jgi:hypothetical protein
VLRIKVSGALVYLLLGVNRGHEEQYLQSPSQLEHACELLLDSDLFAFYSERMCEIL